MAACPRCGEALEPGSLFCGNCGLQVEASGAAPGESPPLSIPGPEKPPGGSYLKSGWHLFKQYPGGFIGFTALTLLIQFGLGSLPKVGWLIFLIDYPLMFGFVAVSARLRQGQSTNFGDFFEGFKNFLTLLLLGVVTRVLIILGLVVLVVPGVYLMVGYILAPWFVLDRKVDFWEAMELSRRTVQHHWFHFFGLVLLLTLINLLGALALGFGLLVTIPVSWCALTAAYASAVGFHAEPQPLAAAPEVAPETAAPSREGAPPPPAAGVAERSLARKYDWTPVVILAGFILVIAAAGIYFWKFAPPSAPPEPVGGPTETSRKPSRPLTAGEYFNKGNAAKDPREKILLYSKAIEKDPKFVAAYNNRGNAYCDREEYDLAMKDYTKAIALKPDYVIAYHNRARLYFDEMDYENALKDMNKVIGLNPRDASSYNIRGNIYFKQKNYEAAINDFTKAIKLKSDFSSAYFKRGHAYLSKEDYEKALADFNKALDLKPDYVNAYYYRAILYKKTGAYDKASADYDKAASLNPRLLDAAFPLPEAN